MNTEVAKPVLIVETPAEYVLLFRINRPQAKNALNQAVRDALIEQFSRLDPSIRCVILTGGEDFAAGADIRDMVDRRASEFLTKNTEPFWRSVSECTVPIVAAVRGLALGGGCELAMHADIIIAGTSAKFGQPEVKLGIMPGAGGTQRLMRALGKYKAMKLLLTGKPILAQEAEAAGLVSEVVSDDICEATAIDYAKTIAALPVLAVRQIKEVALAGQDMPLDAALRLERKAFQLLFDTEDQKEGMRAFIDKRRPEFKGR